MELEQKPIITKVGQRFADYPIYVRPKKIGAITQSVQSIFNPQSPLPRPIMVGYERVELRWMKPDGKGGLIPR